MKLFYSERDVESAVGWPSFVRGQAYQRQGRVLEVRLGEKGNMYGVVRGSHAQPYEQVIAQRDVAIPKTSRQAGGVKTILHGECTCPMEENCKHVAAVLLEALEKSDTLLQPSRGTRRGPDLSRELNAWLMRAQEVFAKPQPTRRAAGQERLVYYVLSLREFYGGNRLEVSPKIMTRLKRGGLSATVKDLRLDYLDNQVAQEAIAPEDMPLLGEIFMQSRGGYAFHGTFSLRPEQAPALLQKILATGRVFWQKPEGEPLRPGPARPVAPCWRQITADRQELVLWQGEGMLMVLPTTPSWYVDPLQRLMGPLETSLSTHGLAVLASLPPVSMQEAPLLRTALQRLLPDDPAWWPAAAKGDLPQRTPTPVLRLTREQVRRPDTYGYHQGRYQSIPGELLPVPAAWLSMDYGGVSICVPDPRPVLQDPSAGNDWFTRDGAFESKALDRCQSWGFTPRPGFMVQGDTAGLLLQPLRTSNLPDPPPEERLLQFLHTEVPRLREEGWRVEVDESFPVTLAQMEDDLSLDVEEGSGMDWFGLELGVSVDGERVSLLPLLMPQLTRLAAEGGGQGAEASPATPETLFAQLPDGRALPVPMHRLSPLLTLLQEWYGPEYLAGGEEAQLPAALSAGLVMVEEAARAAGLRWHGGERLLKMGRRLRDFEKIQAVKPPKTFKGTLRGYQQEGLSWMQFLQEYGFGGILADDMGLGKTVQTLAHLLVEKAAGRMDRPSLVIAPTSLMTNWRLEAARFAPSLKTLVLHGKERALDFDRIALVDVVFTTYALVPRDEKTLLAQPWHMVILDEAHYIKNPSTKAALMVQRLNTRHRLCLTGTPMENHLGELWSLMHFLMPGLLGHKTRFGAYYKNPIEKQGDTQRQRELMQRMRPFVLRRLKSAVEKDLPPKTEILEHLTLEGAQRDLYETLRLAMHHKVREEMAKKGLSRSHITILDALLKLRQVCCDPRLVKLDAAKKVKHSAKFERLFEMLPEMVEEGRRILLFSQFTSMLALMEPELKKHDIGFLKLTGETTKRAPLIEAFQNGEAPVFLLSLKAGGVGLNLTAADTVIHYDPWWNPAVEAQATDRAHRLGQDKAVFVYKLITQGTVEEKIQQLQEKKQALVQSLLDPTAKSAAKITQEDVEWLFAM